ncbi:hypothetical protein EJ04DRAFT_502895 [Polyplosphaeria fusca]|uniref:Uncharacterized protein n=1 Tax=Polyplosphaeria fusca TaxID=682080 RepID=A0A9P4QQI3_9PLEO|nr:hypothetical protein EJ04DRAFT_502895 [Polyplosphaeria fusca]
MPAQGFMLVHPRLHAPSPKTALTFLRWTKVHFRDLVLLPASPGIFTHCLRNVAPVDDAKYSHTAGKGMSPYFYTIVLDDVHALHSQAYADVSRKLDLEHTRALVEGEEAVSSGLGEEAMVWDVVDARFAVFVEEQNGT